MELVEIYFYLPPPWNKTITKYTIFSSLLQRKIYPQHENRHNLIFQIKKKMLDFVNVLFLLL